MIMINSSTKILVTGGAGFIGSSLAEYLLNKTEAQVAVVDNYLTGRQQNLPTSDRFRFIKADANDFNDISSIFQTSGLTMYFIMQQ
jgi:UDP-glucose 4-epimerase